MHSFTLLSTALITVLQVVNAVKHASLLPSRALPIPKDVTHIAHDERSGDYYAYRRDGSFYGRYLKDDLASTHGKRDTSNCIPLTLADAEKMPGWNKIVDDANASWGTGKRNIVVNPPEYLDMGAIVCTSDQPTPVAIQDHIFYQCDQSNCVTGQDTTDGKLVGTNGTVTLSLTQGYTNSVQWTVSETSSFGIGAKISATFGIPEVESVGVEVTTTADFDNTQTNGFSTDFDNTASQSLQMDSADGKTCSASIDTETCNVSATASIQQTATGYIWFNYDSAVQGHYKWAVQIEAVTNLDERSSSIKLAGSMAAKARTKYEGHCA